jgi:hypothetical protein
MKTDPAKRRENEEAVRSVRARIHELNRATVMLYATAIYLGYAQRVRSELSHGQLDTVKDERGKIKKLLENVRDKLNGSEGAGMIDDLQDLMGEGVWQEDGTVISYHEFRERILSPVEWEKYTELFRFFVHFHMKLDSEVERTREALAQLCEVLEKEPAPDLLTGVRTRFRVMALPGVQQMKRQGLRLTRSLRRAHMTGL